MDNYESPRTTAALPARGRRRFQADLKNATETFHDGGCFCGLSVTEIRSGEEEGLICIAVSDCVADTHVVTLNILVSDTSEYPGDHTWLCFTQDEHPPELVLRMIESIPDTGSLLICELVESLLRSLARGLIHHLRTKDFVQVDSDEPSDSDEDAATTDEDVFASDSSKEDEEGFDPDATTSDIQTSVMQSDFVECAEAGYRPGLRRVGIDEVVLSVSLPTFKLADSISPRALEAWDPRLIYGPWYFTMTITGICGTYPVLADTANLVPNASEDPPTFRVGLTAAYKPSAEQCLEFARVHALQRKRYAPKPRTEYWTKDLKSGDGIRDYFENNKSFAFSLSSSLEALMNDCFLPVLALRIKHGIGWAAAEVLHNKLRRLHQGEANTFNRFSTDTCTADDEERRLSCSYNLPPDPLVSEKATRLNLPLLAYSYLLRRLMLCSRFCSLCYEKIETEFQPLKPYVCNNKLCIYQYYNLHLVQSLEYDICSRPQVVDLLVSLTYVAASEGGLHDFPDGMYVVVPDPDGNYRPFRTLESKETMKMRDFDTLDKDAKRLAIKRLIDTLPSIFRIKQHLEQRVEVGCAKPRLQDVDPGVLPAAWSILRWCVASCTAHLEELKNPADRIMGVATNCRQFRLTVGAPNAEAKFRAAQEMASLSDGNAAKYPSVYGWHGSPAKNWHSIIRHGLWYKDIAHGRTYGDGVYFTRNASDSARKYASPATSVWNKSAIQVRSCFALAEIVNLPSSFKSQSPHYVVPQTDWIICRYLIVQGPGKLHLRRRAKAPRDVSDVPRVCLDPKNALTGTAAPGCAVTIPEPSYKLDKLLDARRSEFREAANDEEDTVIFAEHTGHESDESYA